MEAGKRPIPTVSHFSYKLRARSSCNELADAAFRSSRQALKKYIQANNTTAASSPASFDTQFNKAIKSGVDKGDFSQPKGMYSLPYFASMSTLCCFASFLPSRCHHAPSTLIRTIPSAPLYYGQCMAEII